MIKIGRCTSQGLDCYTSPIPGGETTEHILEDGLVAAAATAFKIAVRRMKKRTRTNPQLLRPPLLLLLRSHSKRAAKRERIGKRWARRRRDRERGRRHGGPTSAPTTSARARSGLARTAAIASLPSDSLFNLDKISTTVLLDSGLEFRHNDNLWFVGSFGTATEIPAKRKIEKHKDKILHYESLLQKNPFVQPVPSSTLKKLKRKKKKVDIEKAQTQNASKVCFQI
ncbi:hypothetical protein BHE74_00011760 [Ensete ventricosum]|nr:hypothetical protein BHE74_00011760 [Ensete ventricosum]